MSAATSYATLGMSALTYSLPPHVFIATTGGQAILLDVKRNRYLGFGHAEALLLAAHVRGWPAVEKIGEGPPPASSDTDIEHLLTEMVKQEIVCTDDVTSSGAYGASVATARVALTPIPEPKVVRHLICAMLASAETALKLRLLSLERVVTHVTRRKHFGSSYDVDQQVLAELVHAYLHVRPFLFTAADECLFDSLALVEFLAKHRIHATWVIGVTAAPFAAHSWVQYQDIVLNDVPERVLKYTPILVV